VSPESGSEGPISSRSLRSFNPTPLNFKLSRLPAQPRQLVRGLGVAETLGPDVRDAIALRVRAPHPRLPGEINPQAVGGTQARALADQHRDHLGVQPLADLITKRHARLRCDHHR